MWERSASSSFFPGCQMPAARNDWFPGWTVHGVNINTNIKKETVEKTYFVCGVHYIKVKWSSQRIWLTRLNTNI